VRSKPELASVPEVAKAVREARAELGESGRIVLRYSGTEPVARVMVEAEQADDVERFSRSIAGAIRQTLGR
jgi:phosphoglucosamine mutase